MKPQILTIAGSDSGGGAGIQADIKTITMHNAYALSAITALTAQNTQGVQEIYPINSEFLKSQLHSVFIDFDIKAVKIGMIHNDKNINVIVEIIKTYKPKYIVLDPVMISTSGSHLIDNKTIELMKEELFPLCTLISPNKDEAQLLSFSKIKKSEDFPKAAKSIQKNELFSLLIKGGDLKDDRASDFLLQEDGNEYWFHDKKIKTKNTHGTGCTLSSAICCRLAQDFDLKEAVSLAKAYVFNAIKHSAPFAPGRGNGSLDHNFALNSRKLI